MLKSNVGNQIWLIQQHQHALVSGYLAAHWGGRNRFARLGQYPGATHPQRWLDEVVLAIAEHDNGWWEWEAMPRFNVEDGLPVGLGESAAPLPTSELAQWRSGGFVRWRAGISRVIEEHPYAALLISLHAYWLYAVEFEDMVRADDHTLRHFVFSGMGDAPQLVKDQHATQQFLDEQKQLQQQLMTRLSRDPELAGLIEEDHLLAHLRLLQLLDSMSLYLSLNDQNEHELQDVPRGSWQDRVTIHWQREGDRAVVLDPYPFAIDPLPVYLPMRVAQAGAAGGDVNQASPHALMHSLPMQVVEFEFKSKS